MFHNLMNAGAAPTGGATGGGYGAVRSDIHNRRPWTFGTGPKVPSE